MLYYPFVVPATDFPRCISLTVIFSSQLLTYINCHQHSWLYYYYFIFFTCVAAVCASFLHCTVEPLEKKDGSERAQAEKPIANTASTPRPLRVFPWHSLSVYPPRWGATAQ